MMKYIQFHLKYLQKSKKDALDDSVENPNGISKEIC